MDDLISRQDAIMAVKTGALSAATIYGRTDEGSTALYETVRAIKAIPSAQTECTRECMPMYADVSDCISRQDTVDVIASMITYHKTLDDAYWYVKDDAPSAQPKIIRCKDCAKYDKHDHRCKHWNHGVVVMDWCSRAERRTDGVDS